MQPNPTPHRDPQSLPPATWQMAKFPPDDGDLPDVPDVPDDPPMGGGGDGGGYGDDAGDVRRIKSGTSWMGRITGVLFVVGAGVLGWIYYGQYQNEQHKLDVWNAAQAAPSRDEFLRLITADLPRATSPDVKVLYLQKIAQYRYSAAVPACIAALDTDDDGVRGAAAIALSQIGLPDAAGAKEKLLQILPQVNIAHRAQVIWALAVLREPRASDAIVESFSGGFLQQQPGFDPKVISDVLGPAKLATLVHDPHLAVRSLVAQALAEAASPDAVEPLITLLDDHDPDVVRAAAAGLGRTGDPRAGTPLFALLARQPAMKQSVLDAMKKSIGAAGLVPLLAAATDVELKRTLVQMIADTHDPAAADALFAQVTSEDAPTKSFAALGLAALGDMRAVAPLLEIARGTEENPAQNAIEAITALRAPDAAATLTQILADFPSRHASTLRALAATGNMDACPAIQREIHPDGVHGDEVDDTETALVAVGDLKCQSALRMLSDLLKRPRDVDYSRPSLVTETSYRNRSKACEALGYFGDVSVIPALTIIVEDPDDDDRVRLAATIALGRLADDTVLHTILDKVKNTATDEETREYYVQGLWQRPSRALAPDLLAVVADQAEPMQVRRSCALAVGYAADPSNDERLGALLEDEGARRHAAYAIVLGGTAALAEKLLQTIATDRDTREVLELATQSEDTDDFNLLTQDMFESGEVYRRIEVAETLRDGTEHTGQARFGLAWTKMLERLKTGWGGPAGATPRFVREQLYASLTGTDAARRTMAADALGDMNERGLLFRARDANGPGAQEARNKLRVMNTAGGGAAPH